MGTKRLIVVVDVVIEKLTGVDPSPSFVLVLLPNPIHTINMVARDAINRQPHIQVVHNVEQNVGHDNTIPKSARTLQDPGPSVAAPSISHFPIGVPLDHVGVELDIMEIL